MNNTDVNKLLSQLSNSQKSELSSILGDKEKLNAVLNSPVAKQILEKLNGNQNGKHS